ncbi:MAG: DUF1579 domain-containing protein [Phycisphaerales bacterium]
MKSNNLLASACLGSIGLAAAIGALALAEPAKEMKPAGQPAEMQLPPGWTPEDFQACVAAGTPGDMQKFLAEGAGTWQGKTQSWMAPDTPAMNGECICVITPMMDGRFVKSEFTGEFPGMGPFSGLGLYGFDNVSKKFVSSWIDNQSTGMMQGTGEVSPDRKTLTWKLTYNCPINKKPAIMREIETITGPNTKTMEMWTTDPKSGKEYKMMLIEFTRKS